jgi:2-oxoglutarate dehydrogenase complex dehydrogenase (E1) component-like enzyme
MPRPRCVEFCGRPECYIGWYDNDPEDRYRCRYETVERYFHNNEPVKPKRTTAMIPKHLRIELAAQRVANILGVNWEICNKGTRARCYQIARDCFGMAADDWMPPADDAPAPPIQIDDEPT